jgi:fucose permease
MKIQLDATEPASGSSSEGWSGTASRESLGGMWVVAGSIIVCFLYTGLEVGTGQWSYTLLTVGRGLKDATAGPWVSVYWATLTAGRVAFGWISERFRTETLLRVTSITAVAGVSLLWYGRPQVVSLLGLALQGFSLAPMFPLLIGETPKRVGAIRSNHVVGLQIAAASIGAVSIVGIIGALVEWMGLEAIVPALLVNAMLFGILNEIVSRCVQHGTRCGKRDPDIG